MISTNNGNAIAKRSAVALNGGNPAAIDLLTTTVLPTPTIASAQHI
jgi:hypothetical protein